MAYKLRTYELIGPGWLSEGRFDIVAKVRSGVSRDEQMIMLQNLLSERFELRTHQETKETPAYVLTVTRSGIRLSESRPPQQGAASESRPLAQGFPKSPDGYPILPLGMEATAGRNGELVMAIHRELTMDALAARLSSALGRPVVNETGLDGKYDISLHWRAAPARARAPSRAGDPITGDQQNDGAPDLLDAVREQLGLRLEPTRRVTQVVVVDHALRIPTEN
jgi:uncharacterized protein (TIGR03435 family)